MLQITVSRRHLIVFTAVVALVVSVAWVGVAQRAGAASSTPVVYVATGENFPDALGAGPAAAIVKGPILLVTQNSIPGETAAELTRLAPDRIIIVGGTAVVSPSVEAGLGAYAPTVERIAGANRYDTAARLSASTFPVAASGTGGDADTLDGLDSTAFALWGHIHDDAYLAKTGTAANADLLDGKDSTDFLLKAAYDTDTDGVVDSAEIAVGHAYEGFYADVAGVVADPFYCDIGPMTFGRSTTVVASGGLTLAPLGSTSEKVYGDVAVRPQGASFWTIIESSEIAANLPGGLGFASVPIAAAATLDAGTYEFAVAPRGEDIQINNPDYYGECTLTITAYTGLGPDIEFVG
ncbi:MAG: cell wall-binding repeat-containing protein [Acidimicrobiia bacterium]|nr:cell wall-binding repeat-containing protein [Acidimicrobiia bacterium]